MANVKPVPENLHTITPHLVIRGAAQAIDFYKRALGAQEIYRHAAPDGKIMHAQLRIGDSALFLSDEFPQGTSQSPQSLRGTSIVLNIYVSNVDDLWQRATTADATVRFPLQNQFWGDRYGQVQDPYGHVWALAQRIEEVQPDELERRAREMFAKMAS